MQREAWVFILLAVTCCFGGLREAMKSEIWKRQCILQASLTRKMSGTHANARLIRIYRNKHLWRNRLNVNMTIFKSFIYPPTNYAGQFII